MAVAPSMAVADMTAESRSHARARRSRSAGSGSASKSLSAVGAAPGTADAHPTRMLRIILLVAGAVAVGGCDMTYCEQPHRVASSSNMRPGTVRAAAVLR